MRPDSSPASVAARAWRGPVRSLASVCAFVVLYAAVEYKTSYSSAWPLIAVVVGGSAMAAGLGLRYVWAQPGTLARNAFIAAVALVGAFGIVRSFGFGLGLPGAFEIATMTMWLAIGAFFLIPVLRSRIAPPGTLDVAAPLRGRIFTVNGGSGLATNHHVVEPTMRYAVDLVAVDSRGMRAHGLAPTNPARYVVFGHDVHCAAAGVVTEVYDELPDQLAGEFGEQPLRGNFVVIEDGSCAFTYAHLRHGSVRVAVGQHVPLGEIVAAVGNTGNSSEPHLHLHAIRDGRSVPLTVQGRFLVRNDLLVTADR